MQTILGKPEEVLTIKGEESNEMFFIHSGTIEISVESRQFPKQNGTYFIAEAGQVLGEIGVTLNTQRTAHSRSRDYCVLSVLSKKHFQMLNSKDRMLGKLMKANFLQYKDSNTIQLKQILMNMLYQERIIRQRDLNIDKFETRRMSIFQLPQLRNKQLTAKDAVVGEILFQLQYEKYNEGQTIMLSKDPIDSVIIVLQGEIDVIMQATINYSYVIETLYENCHFGF